MIVDDEPLMLRAWKRMLDDQPFDVTVFSDPEAVPPWLEKSKPDLMVIDVRMPRLSGIDLLEMVKERWPQIPVIMTSASSEVGPVVASVRKGAVDFLLKPYENLQAVVETLKAAAASPAQPEAPADLGPETLGLVGMGPKMQEVADLVVRVAAHSVPVLIAGETGTGKELVARAIHSLSPRHHRPLLALNCAALTESLLEEELFGHRKGAFTGASTDRRGLLETADGGTVFLDEIEGMSSRCQALLLRTLQEGEVRPVGSSTARVVDVRILAATNEDLEAKCRAGSFRWDLYHRLNVVCVELPPLRERLEDLPLLVQHFLEKCGARFGKTESLAFKKSTLDRLAQYSWPGNVRELENTITRAVALTKKDKTLSTSDLPAVIVERSRPPSLAMRALQPEPAVPCGASRTEAKEEFERTYLTDLLQRHRSIAGAARAANMDRSNFKRLLRRHRIAWRGEK